MGCRRPGKAWRLSGRLLRAPPEAVIWMLTIYPKNVVDSIPGHMLKKIREEIGDD